MKALHWMGMAAIGGLLGMACHRGEDSSDGEGIPRDGREVLKQAQLIQFESCDELEDYIEKIAMQEMSHWSGGQYYYGLPETPRGVDAGLGGDDDDAAPPEDDLSGQPGEADDDGQERDYTDTNTQEAGVDEADIVKTDGERLYILSGGYLSLVDAEPADNLTLRGSIAIEGGPIEMYVAEGVAMVFSSTGGWYGGPVPMEDAAVDFAPGGEWTPPRLKVTLVNLADPSNPEVIRETYFDGNYSGSRRIGRRVHLVVDSYLDGPELEYDPGLYIEPPQLADCEAPLEELWSLLRACEGESQPGDDADSDGVAPLTGRSAEEGTSEPGDPGEDPDGPPSDSEGPCAEIWAQINAYHQSSAYRECNEANERAWNEYNERYQREYEAALEEMIERNREKIRNAGLADWLPRLEENGQERFIVDCGGFYRPDFSTGRGVVSVLTLDLAAPVSNYAGTAVVSNPGIVYASPEALYLAAYAYDYWMWYGGFETPPPELTRLHKFDLSGEAAQYVASGEVPGQPLNQFSLGEQADHLRIATTTQAVWSGPVDDDDEVPVDPGTGVAGRDGAAASALEVAIDTSRISNHVFVLGQDGDALEITGAITEIAPDERIYSARFMGDRGFLVTFRQIDPLFTLDLSDPADPRIVGELEVPGFSTYLHPLGEDHLLAIGDAVDERGNFRQGLQLSLFDVSDFAAPRLAHRLLIGEGWSEASYNHKAFTYYPSRGVLAIPMSLWYPGPFPEAPGGYFNGVLVFDVDVADGIAERGRVDHADFLEDGGYYYSVDVRRSVFIEDTLFTLSELGVKASNLSNLTHDLDSIELPHRPYEGYCGDPMGGVCYEDIDF